MYDAATLEREYLLQNPSDENINRAIKNYLYYYKIFSDRFAAPFIYDEDRDFVTSLIKEKLHQDVAAKEHHQYLNTLIDNVVFNQLDLRFYLYFLDLSIDYYSRDFEEL